MLLAPSLGFHKSEEASMIGYCFRIISRPVAAAIIAVLAVLAFLAGTPPCVYAMSSTRGGSLPQPLPLFPSDNWWNLDISNWPVDPNSASYIGFINNGGTRRLHPDFGGNAETTQDPYAIYGMPYAVVRNVSNSDLQSVEFLYSDESDGVDHSTNTSYPFYPIPPEAITQPYWVEGGDPGNVDLRSSEDRHLLIVDGDRNYLYELYNVFYNSAQARWFAGSGGFFDMNTNNRRPDGWTSADAAGLAILPGLVRYDEVYDSTVAEIAHAFRATVRATNGYVYPASHRAGNTSGALPMGARLRLKASVDVTQRTSDPNVQKIFRAMQRYGLVVTDNGSDMYITGTYDTRWNNDILNPAFSQLSANDFEVIQLGYNPSSSSVATLASMSINPATVTGGQSTTGTVSLTGPAPANGASVSLSSANTAASVPSAVLVAANTTSATFPIATTAVGATSIGNITAIYSGMTKTASLSVQPGELASLTLRPSTVSLGASSVGTVTLSGPAPDSGAVVMLASTKPMQASLPASVTVPAGSRSATFTISTTAVNKKTVVTITASYRGVTNAATLTLQRR
jgi:hypothetical protein